MTTLLALVLLAAVASSQVGGASPGRAPAAVTLGPDATVLRTDAALSGASGDVVPLAGEQSWTIDSPQPQRCEVEVTWARTLESAGAMLEVRDGGSSVSARLYPTAVAEPLVTVPLGLLDVPAGRSTLVLRSAGTPGGGSAAVREVTLRAGYRSLFDGKSLDGWQLVGRQGAGYVVEEGAIVCTPDEGGNLFTTAEYRDFSFRFEFALSDGANNGVGIRAPLEGDAAYVGMEIQILDNESDAYRDKLKPWQYHGSIYGIAPAPRGHLYPTGAWNREEILCRGRHVTVTLNGARLVDFDLDSVTDAEILAAHPGVRRAAGHIGFLAHQSRVTFRDIRIKELP